MQTDNLELKKLVYLYLMNYAKSQPDMAIMAVNTFVKVGGREMLLDLVVAWVCWLVGFCGNGSCVFVVCGVWVCESPQMLDGNISRRILCVAAFPHKSQDLCAK